MLLVGLWCSTQKPPSFIPRTCNESAERFRGKRYIYHTLSIILHPMQLLQEL